MKSERYEHMKIETLFEKKKPVLSFEIFPPKKEKAIQQIDETLEILSQLNPDFISVTCGALGSEVTNLTLELARKIKHQYHIEPLVHLTCINHNKQEILDFLEEMRRYDLENILALRGDRNPDLPEKKDFLHATDLISFLKKQGDFSIAAACYPEGHIDATSKMSDYLYLKQKQDAGAGHFVSQLFYDNQLFYSFLEQIRQLGVTKSVEAGIMPVLNKSQIERITSLCGASLPEKFRKVMTKYEDNKEALFDAGMAYAINQIVDLLASDVDGVHIYTMNNPSVAKRICRDIEHLIK